MLKFDTTGGGGSIKVTPTNKYKEEIKDSLKTIENAIKAPISSDDYVIQAGLYDEEAILYFTRKKDSYGFGFLPAVLAFSVPMTFCTKFELRFFSGEEAAYKKKYNARVSVTNELMHSVNKDTLYQLIVDKFANEMTKALQLTPKEARIILGNFLTIPGLKAPTYNGTFFHFGGYGESYVKSGYVFPEPNENLKLDSLNKPLEPPSKPQMDISILSTQLPGVHQEVFCPLRNDKSHQYSCSYGPKKATIWSVIQHLNDETSWTREQIADWLDSLADDGIIDIDFKIPSEESSELGDIIEDEIQAFLGEQNGNN